MKSVYDLNLDELDESRSRWYDQHLDDGSLEEVLGGEIVDESEVDMEVVKAYYEDTYFTDDDFFCNL